MRAITYETYRFPKVLRLSDVPVPTRRPGRCGVVAAVATVLVVASIVRALARPRAASG